ncbi:MAG TPA: hypothetical protein VJ861_01225, partial [Treponemataceae bacterium]|nr:hypothetical protein [Treponemataceae bacterium]
EVKNLANRSAASAKETAQMIKLTLQKTDEGQNLTKQLADIFKEIMLNSGKSNEMTKEVETASRQQDEGISQVNKAIIQLDTVVQQNAAASEETASAAEELQSQVVTLNEVIDNLSILVLGEGSGINDSHNRKASASRPGPQKSSRSLPAVRSEGRDSIKEKGKRIKFDDDPEFQGDSEF